MSQWLEQVIDAAQISDYLSARASAGLRTS